jgi:hypothetical protein
MIVGPPDLLGEPSRVQFGASRAIAFILPVPASRDCVGDISIVVFALPELAIESLERPQSVHKQRATLHAGASALDSARYGLAAAPRDGADVTGSVRKRSRETAAGTSPA